MMGDIVLLHCRNVPALLLDGTVFRVLIVHCTVVCKYV